MKKSNLLSMINKYLYVGIKYLFLGGMIFMIVFGAIYEINNIPISLVRAMYAISGLYIGFTLCLVIHRSKKEEHHDES